MHTAARGRKTFYDCVCPELPDDASDMDVMNWIFWHYKNCKARKITDLPLPAFTEEDE